MKKKVNNVRDMVISVEFDPIEIGFIQASIDTYLEKAREKFGDKDDLVNLPSIESMAMTCLGKFDKAEDELEKNYEWGEIDD
ncbi:hypothetical protein ANHYDRO_01393 [Anaerococcus hydrogenalis DSM 7454]|uniref:Uncharacterized protein n=1 Tax=Anaerococcus hydrogenalis DSM 7454 TaxID=561177 RepID=B6W9W7_9FIRM|nr:hypothetical protein [Anaerococcus hydrogenalis]EEB35727.1 hypothetical protein ANHYDRO_01393 [Anaerococcus hydrogenalis DSM 7454]